MRFKIDENLSAQVKDLLIELVTTATLSMTKPWAEPLTAHSSSAAEPRSGTSLPWTWTLPTLSVTLQKRITASSYFDYRVNLPPTFLNA